MNTTTRKCPLWCSVIIVLVGACLLCDWCHGVLLDHGPLDPNLNWPQWYRENSEDKLALGICTSTASSENGPLCFPIQPSPVPPSFPGNVGDEIFYFNMNVNIESGDINLRYITALEAAYGTLNPVGAAVKGQEIVFSRVRFVMSIADGADQRCAGEYTIVHPYGTEVFPDVSGTKRALVVTLDKPMGAAGDFDGVLTAGDVGPFLRWDSDFPVRSGNDEFIGDPNVEHTYTGSPFNQNFVEIRGPTGCNLDGVGNNVVRSETGLVLGQIWTAPIPTPTTTVSAVYSRTGSDNVVDVEAKAAPGNKLLLTAPSPFPSTLLVEDKNAEGTGLGKFHAHVEYSGDLPSSIRVVNLASNPVISAEADLVDIIQISIAEYNPNSNTICVHAKSSNEDTLNPPTLALRQPFGEVFPTTPSGCSPASGFLCVCVSLPNGGSQVTSQSTPVTVISTKGGVASANVKYLTGNPNNQPVPSNLAAEPDSFTVATAGPTTVNVGANDRFEDGGGTSFVIVQQPAIGTVSTTPTLGSLQYTPSSGAIPGTTSFLYLIQQAGDVYSNVASVSIVLEDTVQPPTTAPDVFVVRVNTAKSLDILANDLPSRGTTIDKGSITVDTTGTRGIVNVNNGIVTYSAPSAPGVDSFTYTVMSAPAGTTSSSVPTTVSISVPQDVENIVLSKARATTKGRWVLVGDATAAGWVGSITVGGGSVTINPIFTCYMRSGNTFQFIGRANFIGTAPPQATIDVSAGSLVTLPDGTDGRVPSCGTTKGQSCTVQCATSNVVSPYPSTSVGGTDRPSATVPVK